MTRQSIVSYFTSIRDAFSLRFILYLGCTQLFVKGSLMTIASGTFLPIFKRSHVDAVHVQLYMTLAMSPWTIKPLIGVISDSLTIGGYHKKYYVLQSIVVGVISAFSLIFASNGSNSPIWIVLCFFGLHYQISICDLLSEGAYAKRMRERPETGTDIVTLVSGFQMVGTLIALILVGPLSDIGLFYPLFIIGGILGFTPFIPSILNWLPEEKQHGWKCVELNTEFVRQEFIPLLIVALTGLSGPVLAILTLYVNDIFGIIAALIMASLAVAGSFVAFPDLVGRVALFQVIVQLSKPSLGSAMDFFFTADQECLPGGPSFSFKYYITYTGILGAFISVVATLLYQRFMSKWKFRTVLISTSILVAIAGLSDLVLVLRLNIAMGIPDKVFYMIGEAIIESTVQMLFWIPSSAIISKACPPNMEATTYAFLAGISNFGAMTSSMLGAILFNAAGVKTTPGLDGCDFTALPYLILVFHTITPLVGCIGASFLIPNMSQVEEQEDEIEIEMYDPANETD